MFFADITFVIFTFNEEARIGRVVRNFVKYGHVLLLDDGSTDRTKEIAEQLGATVIRRKKMDAATNWSESEPMADFVKEVVTTPWIYWGFADEFLDQPTMDAMMAAVRSGRYGIVDIVRKNYYYGKFMHDCYLSRQPRAFKKEAVDFRGNAIHHFGKPTVPESEICYLDGSKHFVHHFISNTAKVYLGSIDKYTDIDARTLPERSPLGTLARVVKHFLLNFFWHGGYKAGRAGFYLTLQMAYYTMLLSMKLHENKNGLTTQGIEELNNVTRERLLGDFTTGTRP